MLYTFLCFQLKRRRILKGTNEFSSPLIHKSGDVQDGNIFETLYDIEDLEPYGNVDDSEDVKAKADKLIETLRNNFSDDALFIFNEDTIKQLNELYESHWMNAILMQLLTRILLVRYMRNYQI